MVQGVWRGMCVRTEGKKTSEDSGAGTHGRRWLPALGPCGDEGTAARNLTVELNVKI